MIDLLDITKHYDGGMTRALRGISLAIPAGQCVSLMGPSGCGKSTLLNLIGALDEPTSGDIRVLGQRLDQWRPFHRYRATQVGFVFQFHHLLPHLTLAENVEVPMHVLPLSRKQRRQRAADLLREMGLAHLCNCLPTRVSGGERQRAAIARALANDPAIILADEPTGNLDSDNGQMVIDYLLLLAHRRGKTLIMATHNHALAYMTDRVVHMLNGQLVPVVDAQADPNLKDGEPMKNH
jgi:putative ABC transport system ATP-binding protein